MDNYFAQDPYNTPENVPLSRFGAMFPSLYFYSHLIPVVASAGRRAARGEYTAADWVDSSQDVGKILERVGTRIHVENLHYASTLEGPCVFLANHMSTLETFLLPSIIQPVKNVTFVVKSSLMQYPWLGHVLQAKDPIVVQRTNPREDLEMVLNGGTERLQQGISIIIFPQGTRSHALNPEDFNTLAAKLARKASVPLIPIALKTDAWGTGKWIKDLGWIRPSIPVHVRFGAPMTINGNGKEENAAAVSFIKENFDSWVQA